MQNLFRAIPSVDASLAALHRADAALADSQQTPHALLRDLVAAFWDNKRESIRAGTCKNADDLRLEHQLPALLEFVQRGLRPRFRSALNATGVVVHTNMGRSVLAADTPLGTGWATLLSITPTMVAGAALLTCTGWIGNGDSGGQRTALVQLTRDGANLGTPHNYVLPAVAGATVGQPIAITIEIPAETAGAHTYTMKVMPSIASAVVVCRGSRLAVEQGGM